MIFDEKHLDPDKLKLYIKLIDEEKPLTEDQKKILFEIEKHLNSCFKCNAEYLFLKSVYFPRVSKYEVSKKIRNYVLISATSVVILFFLSQTIFLSDNKNTKEVLTGLSNENKTVIKDSLEENGKIDTDFAKKDHFVNESIVAEKNKKENLVELLYAYADSKRSGKIESNLLDFANGRNVELPETFIEDYRQDLRIDNNVRYMQTTKVLNPENLSILTPPIYFEWEKIEDEVEIVIKNNRNEKIWEKKITGSSKLGFNEELSPGTYYWDLRINDQLINKYKFFIKP